MPTHIFPYCATPKGLANTVGAAHTRVRHVAGCRKNLLHPYHRSVGSPPTCKGQAASGCFASLDRSPAPSASVNVAMFTEVERGQGRREAVHFLPLTPWSRPNTPPQGSGGWVLTACPCGAASEAGVWGKAPRCYFRKAAMYCKCMRLQKI